MKQTIKRLLKALGFKSRRYIDCCFEYDASVYARNSGLHGDDMPVVAAKMRILCHTIEKGLSLPDCRADFGREKVKELAVLYLRYKAAGGCDKNALEVVKSTVRAYIAYRDSNGLDSSFIPNDLINDEVSYIMSGAMPMSSVKDDFASFNQIAKSRHSVRNYSDRPVSQDDIVKAVELAQSAPSACNRQATRIYAITDKEKISLLKQRHGGIRTFGVPGVIFVITQDLTLYLNEYERNTWLVDGGIFCMNLLYALNYVGLVNCPVILGGMPDEDKFLAELAGIPDSERPVILVVAGYPAEQGCKTPVSPKRPVDSILKIIQK